LYIDIYNSMNSPSQSLVNIIYDYKDQLTDEAWINIMDALHKEYKIEINNHTEYKYKLRVCLNLETTLYHIEEEWKEEHDDYYEFDNELCVHRQETVKTPWEVEYKSMKPVSKTFIPSVEYDENDFNYDVLNELNKCAKVSSMTQLFGGHNSDVFEYHYGYVAAQIERGCCFYVVRGETKRFISSVKTIVD